MEDQEIKELLSTTKKKADAHLKDRIIHQIHTERALIPKKNSLSTTASGNHFSLFGIMYGILFVLMAYFYLKTDGKLLQSYEFIIASLLVASTFSIYWLIMVYGYYRKLKE